jgi:hypothetical protein
MVKDINRHADLSNRLVYEGTIDHCNTVDMSVVECQAYSDWSLKNNLKLMKDRAIGKVV